MAIAVLAEAPALVAIIPVPVIPRAVGAVSVLEAAVGAVSVPIIGESWGGAEEDGEEGEGFHGEFSSK